MGALIVLCWTPGKGSPVHDHPGDGCWMSVLQGGLRETHYKKGGEGGSLQKTSENVYCRQDGDGVKCAFIDDSIALHKIEKHQQMLAQSRCICTRLHRPCAQ